MLNALGLHAAVPPPPSSSSTSDVSTRATPYIYIYVYIYPGSLFGQRTSTSNLLHLLQGVTAAAAAPAVIIPPVLGRYSLIHSVLRPRLRFCLSNISYIKAQPPLLCVLFLYVISSFLFFFCCFFVLRKITSLRARRQIRYSIAAFSSFYEKGFQR